MRIIFDPNHELFAQLSSSESQLQCLKSAIKNFIMETNEPVIYQNPYTIFGLVFQQRAVLQFQNQQMHSEIVVPKVQKNMLLFLQANLKSLDVLLIQMQTLSFKIKSAYQSKPKKQLKRQAQRIIEKIKMIITKHHQAITKITQKQMTEGALKRMKNFMEKDFTNIVRDANCFRDIVEELREKQGECEFYVDGRKREMAQKIRNFKKQIDDQWDKANAISFSPEILDQSKTVATLPMRQGISLEQEAMSQLQKQFLAIRMISYKMYEQYTGHEHDDLREDIQKTREEQQKLQKELVEAKQNRNRLLEEQRELSKQLSQLKKCNQAIGRRYFILKDQTASEFQHQQIY